MAKATNPFEHHHHHDADNATEPLDPAQESLADALRVSFQGLKWVMILLFAWYLLSNTFSVSEQQVAVRLRFGHFIGDTTDKQVLNPGGPYFSLPYPIDQIIRVPTSVRTLNLNDSFWYALSDAEKAMDVQELTLTKLDPLSPERDSYLVTGDTNIMHARWSISYQVNSTASDVLKYVKNVGNEESATQIMQAVAERGVVTFAARHTADDMINGLDDEERAQVEKAMQDSLDELQSGLHIISVTMIYPMVPNPVHHAFASVTRAENERRQKVEQVLKIESEILNGAAGRAHVPLVQLIGRYAGAYEKDDFPTVETLEAQLSDAFENLRIAHDDATLPISGEVATIINQARTYRDQTVKDAQAEATAFQSYFKQYQENPKMVMAILWQNKRREIMRSRVETLVIPKGTKFVYLTTPNQALRAEWEHQDTKVQEEKN